MKPRKILLGVLALCSLIPFPTTTVPEWKLRYIDKKSQPVAGLPLRQTWQNYSIESQGRDTDGSTDAQGYVVFPEHQSWSPILIRALHPILNVLSAGVHASFGNTSWVIPMCDVREAGPAQAIYYGQPLPSEIVLTYEDGPDLRASVPGSMPVPSGCTIIEAQVRNAT